MTQDVGVTRIRHDHCPQCGKVVNATTPIRVEGAMPRKGDLTVCLGCGAIAVFDERSRLRRPTIEDLHECDGRGMFDLLWSSYLVRFGDYLTEEAPHAHDA